MAEGDLVAVRWTTRANLVGFPVLMRGMVGKRGPIVSTGVNLYRFRDGRVVEIWNNRDDLTVLREGGVFRWYGVSGFVVGVLVALVAGWGLRRRHVAREGRGA